MIQLQDLLDLGGRALYVDNGRHEQSCRKGPIFMKTSIHNQTSALRMNRVERLY